MNLDYLLVWYAVCSMGELTERDDDIIRVPENFENQGIKSRSYDDGGNAFMEKLCGKNIA